MLYSIGSTAVALRKKLVKLKTQSVIGFPVTAESFETQVDTMLGWAQQRLSKVVCVANVHMLIEAKHHMGFASILHRADMLTPDGMPLVWLTSWISNRRQERVAGMDILFSLCHKATEKNVSLFFLGLPYPLIVLAAGVFGFWRGHQGVTDDEVVPSPCLQWRRTGGTIILGLMMWWLPILAMALLAAPDILLDIAAFFSKLAVVTFGGAYAVLAYMAQDVVDKFGWLTAGEMIDGLGLAETTPGPLILVTQFVGFLAGHGAGGLPMAMAAAAVTLWVTFVPCFLWIFAGAPYIDWLCAQPRLKGALDGITAAVVGVILNLSIWFALHVFFGTVTRVDWGIAQLWLPEITTIDWRVLPIALVAGFLLLARRWSMVRVLAVAALLGLGLTVV